MESERNDIIHEIVSVSSDENVSVSSDENVSVSSDENVSVSSDENVAVSSNEDALEQVETSDPTSDKLCVYDSCSDTLMPRESTPEPETHIEVKRSSITMGSSRWFPITVEDDNVPNNNLKLKSAETNCEILTNARKRQVEYNEEEKASKRYKCGHCDSEFPDKNSVDDHAHKVHADDLVWSLRQN